MKRNLILSALLLLTVCSSELPAQSFGRQFPHGNAAVNYLYSANGTWKAKTGIVYNYSFYSSAHYADIGVTCSQPQTVDPSAAIAYADDSNHASPDADCHLIADLDNDLLISDENPQPQAASFVEHSGKGADGASVASPFLQFWFDDNWLARIMAQTYGKSSPTGLHDNSYRIRWRVLEGSNTGWTNYTNDNFLDRLAINGLAYANSGDWSNALSNWNTILDNFATPTWNTSTKRYDYAFTETYYLGLWLILTERLYADGGFDTSTRQELLQHAASLHTWLLATQETASGARIGWRTAFNSSPNGSLINTETTALSVLGLAAEAYRVYEAGFSPMLMCSTCGFTLSTVRKHVFATVAASSAGHMVYGPYTTLPVGAHSVDFDLRLPSGCTTCTNNAVTVDVYDGTNIVTSSVLLGNAFSGTEWNRFRLTFNVTDAAAPYEFRVWYHDNMDVDAASVRVN